MNKLKMALLVACIVFDLTRNSTLVEFFTRGEGFTYYVNWTSWLTAAVVFALLPVLLDGKMARNAAFVSATFSVFAAIMGYLAGDMSDMAHAQKLAFHQKEQIRLDNELQACDSMSASACKSLDVREQIKNNTAEMAMLKSTVTLDTYDIMVFGTPINVIKIFEVVITILVSIAIPYFNANIAQELKFGTVLRTNDTKNGSNTKDADGFADKKTKTADKKRKSAKPTTDEQDKVLMAAYQKIAKEKGGKKPRKTDFRGRGLGVSNDTISWWYENVLPTANTNVIRLGVTHDRD